MYMFIARNLIEVTVMKNKKTDFSSQRRKSTRQKNKPLTPLQQFDMSQFFEENLFDIIELEENRSGIEEFEKAAKRK